MTEPILPILLGALLLSAPRAEEHTESLQPIRTVNTPTEAPTLRKDMHIRSTSCDYDGKSGAIVFKGDVHIDYEDEYTLTAERVLVLLAESNRLERVVASGNVVISNGLHLGTCAMATYHKTKGEVEMFGDRDRRKARLIEYGESTNEVEGDRIRFWIGSEEVEIFNSRLSIEYAKQENAR